MFVNVWWTANSSPVLRTSDKLTGSKMERRTLIVKAEIASEQAREPLELQRNGHLPALDPKLSLLFQIESRMIG